MKKLVFGSLLALSSSISYADDVCIHLRNQLADHNYNSIYYTGRKGIGDCRVIDNGGYMGVVINGIQVSNTRSKIADLSKDFTEIVCENKCFTNNPPVSNICLDLRNKVADRNVNSIYYTGRKGIGACRIIDNGGFMGVVINGIQVTKTNSDLLEVARDFTNIVCENKCE